MNHLKNSKIVLTPILLKVDENTSENDVDCSREPYFLWSTNTTQHKNHRRAIEAINKYYLNGGKLKCVITGATTRLWKPEVETTIEYVKEIKEKLHSTEVLRKNILILGNLPKNKYVTVLKNACFVFHPGYGDNGNGTVFDAAAVGVPSVVSDYEPMHYLSNYASIPMKYFDHMNSDAICKALIEMENDYLIYKNKLPPKEDLERSCYKNKGQELCDVIKDIVDYVY